MYQHIKTLNLLNNALLTVTVLSFGGVVYGMVKQTTDTVSIADEGVMIERIAEDDDNSPATQDTAQSGTSATVTENTEQSQTPVTDIADNSANAQEETMAVVENETQPQGTSLEQFLQQQQEQEQEAQAQVAVNDAAETAQLAENTMDNDAQVIEPPAAEETANNAQETETLTANAGAKSIEDVLGITTDGMIPEYDLGAGYIPLPEQYEAALPVPIQKNQSAMSDDGYVMLNELSRASILAGYCVSSHGSEGFALNLQKFAGRDSFKQHEEELKQYQDVGVASLEQYDKVIDSKFRSLPEQKELCQAALDAEIVVRSFIPGI